MRAAQATHAATREVFAWPPHTYRHAFCVLRCPRHPAIEKWAKYKEDYHLRFRWTPRRTFDVLLWGLFVPFCVYSAIKNEQKRVEKQNGRPDSKFGP